MGEPNQVYHITNPSANTSYSAIFDAAEVIMIDHAAWYKQLENAVPSETGTFLTVAHAAIRSDYGPEGHGFYNDNDENIIDRRVEEYVKSRGLAWQRDLDPTKSVQKAMEFLKPVVEDSEESISLFATKNLASPSSEQ